MTTKNERYRRIALLERAIAERGWSLQLKRAMAAEFGVTQRTIDNYKADLVDCYRKQLEGDEWEAQRAGLESRIVGVDGPSRDSGGGIVIVAPRVKV